MNWSNGSQAREKIRSECFRSCSILSECHKNLIAKCRTHPFQKSVNIATRITFPRLKFKQLITKKKAFKLPSHTTQFPPQFSRSKNINLTDSCAIFSGKLCETERKESIRSQSITSFMLCLPFVSISIRKAVNDIPGEKSGLKYPQPQPSLLSMNHSVHQNYCVCSCDSTDPRFIRNEYFKSF